jgi:hypothetical protein
MTLPLRWVGFLRDSTNQIVTSVGDDRPFSSTSFFLPSFSSPQKTFSLVPDHLSPCFASRYGVPFRLCTSSPPVLRGLVLSRSISKTLTTQQCNRSGQIIVTYFHSILTSGSWLAPVSTISEPLYLISRLRPLGAPLETNRTQPLYSKPPRSPSGLNTRKMSDADHEWKPKARPQSCVILPSIYI